jgi:putative membrane protein
MKRISIKAVGLTVAAALGLAGGAWAKQDTSSDANMSEQPQAQEPNSSAEAQQPGSQIQPGNLTSGERNFLQSAAEINATEVQLGRIAAQKSNDPNIQKIGEGLVRDHTAANQQLQRLASSKGVAITEQPTSSQQRMINSLSQTSGERFNKQFLRQTRLSHERALSLFERASRRAQDSDIRTWAGQMVPSVQEHLAMLKSGRPEAVAEKANPNTKPQQQQQMQPKQQQPQQTGGQQPQGGY